MDRPIRAFVAGGTGAAGRAYVRALVAAGFDVTATARDDGGAQGLADAGADALAVDLRDAHATADAMHGSSAVFVAVMGRGQDAAADEEEVTRAVFEAATRAGVDRLVYTSVHHADRATGVPHFEVKGRLEGHLASTGLLATVLRPCTFMEALSAPWIRDGVISRSVLASPIALDTRISYVAASDVAEVGVRALSDPGLAGTTMTLAGPTAVTYRDLLPVLSKLVGTDVEYQNVPLDVVEEQFGADLATMVRFFNGEGFDAAPDPAIERLGVTLTSVDEFIETAYASATAGAGEAG